MYWDILCSPGAHIMPKSSSEELCRILFQLGCWGSLGTSGAHHARKRAIVGVHCPGSEQCRMHGENNKEKCRMGTPEKMTPTSRARVLMEGKLLGMVSKG